MNDKIMQFIEQQTSATICCVDEGGKPYCFSCFYAFDPDEGFLLFKSSADSHHSILLQKNPFVGGTILPDKLNSLLVKGIQFEGIVLPEDHPQVHYRSATYYKKHPLAIAIHGSIHVVCINAIKMTDSTMGFGKKITWKREEPVYAD